MKSCIRCGQRMSHNYLEAIFTMVNDKRERLIVCAKCKEILTKLESKPKAASSSAPSAKKSPIGAKEGVALAV